MAGLNVAEWTPEQVSEWLAGLGPAVAQYVPTLRARGLNGTKLLMLRCDDLEYLGMHVIGHQELLLEAVEHLRNFQYELSRECIQQLALRVSVVATSLVRALRHHTDARLETQTLADVARTVHAVKPLICWLDRWSLGGRAGWVGGCRAQLLRGALEAATCAMRERFAEQPARGVRAAAGAAAAAAARLARDAADPAVLQPAALHAAALRPRRARLGFSLRLSCCGHLQLADLRFGEPAHASGAVHAGDELVQVGPQCVVGWECAAVERACAAAAARGELALRLRRRAPRPPPLRRARLLYREEPPAARDSASSDGSEPLSPPASPTLHSDHTRMYPIKPRPAVSRRHTVCGGSPVTRRPLHDMDQLWQQLRSAAGAEGAAEAEGAEPPYARDKAGSCAGLHARPRTSPAGARAPLDKARSTPAYGADPPRAPAPAPPHEPARDRAPHVVVHSAQKADQILQFKKSSSQIEEAMQQRRAPDDCLPPVSGTGVRDDSSTEKVLETINIAMMEHRRRSLLEAARSDPAPVLALAPALAPTLAPAPGGREGAGDAPGEDRPPAPRYSYLRHTPRPRPASPPPSPPPRPAPAPAPASSPAPAPADPLPVLRAVPRDNDREPTSPMKPMRPLDVTQISVPLRHLTPHDMHILPAGRRAPPPTPSTPSTPAPTTPPAPGPADIVVGAHAGDARGHALSPTSAVRGMFPNSKSRSLKKKSSILAKRRAVPCRAVCARGAAGGVWQRVRARSSAAQPRWVRRHLLLTHNLLYAYRAPECLKADCMIYLEGCTVCAAGEVKSRAHAFKVYHTGNAFYFACDSRDNMLAWIQLIHRATLLPSLLSHVDVARQFSETDYSETESDTETPDKRNDKDKDKSKFGSLKKLTVRMQRSESQENVSHSSTSLDRKYLRFFSRHRSKDDSKAKNKQSVVPVPTEHYRSYRRVPPVSTPDAPRSPHAPHSSDAPPADRLLGSELRASKKIPKPINYIHASNPNLLDFEKSDFVTKPTLQVPTKPKVTKPESLSGLVTLEQFMLRKQEEERRQLYSNRVLVGIERASKQLQHRLDRIVPDVIYGEVCPGPAPGPEPAPVPALPVAAPVPAPAPAARPSTATYKERRPEPGKGKPISVKGKDGYEKIVYTDDPPETLDDVATSFEASYGVAASNEASYGVARDRRPAPPPAPPPAPERWRDSLRRNDKVHTHAHAHTHAHDTWHSPAPPAPPAAGPAVSRLRLMFGAHAQPGPPPQYPHLQCPPTFHPETYSLAAPPRPSPPPPPHTP